MARNVFINIGGFIGGKFNQSTSGTTGVEGSGSGREETRDLSAFDRLQSSIPGDIEVRRGEKSSIVIRADDNIVPLIKTDVSGGTLKVSASGSFSTRTPIRVLLTVAGEFPDTDLTGSGDVVMAEINQKSVSINVQGSGDVHLSGTVEKLDIKVMGSGDVHAKRLQSKDLTISLMGSGDVDAHATESVNVSLMGSGDVNVTGSPTKVRSSAMGSGDVTVR
ncbi:DUF2807 domain-containing protein [Agrobacterium rubi]|nr:DUF2807 domain-containing protein [Agrobacterium rubi]NTF24926.1 DUF2807 domain-containing protein [Agrobacterium rubi]